MEITFSQTVVVTETIIAHGGLVQAWQHQVDKKLAEEMQLGDELMLAKLPGAYADLLTRGNEYFISCALLGPDVISGQGDGYSALKTLVKDK